MRAVHGILVVGLAAVVAGVSCSSGPETPPPPPFRTDIGVQRLMQLVLDPAADQLWDSVHTTVTEQGVEEVFPRNDEEWDSVRNGAAVLVESGNLLMMGGRARDNDDWLKMSLQLTEAGTAALRAAELRDVAGVFDTGGVVYEACRNCHQKYWPDDPNP